ncbi:gamma-glutamyl kinase [Algirhabdus cladophorae]|uniref:gamma-glutamyl kinase n=1 Tax=Algirhabdus cladophorae TaxID=3377108 RepID=UPI003B84A23B
MMIFTGPKLAFLSQSKTGSSAYQAALGAKADIVITNPTTLKHATIQRFDRFLKPMLAVGGVSDVETLGVIREPISWLGSWYRYRSRPFLDGHANSTKDVSFDQFVTDYMAEDRPSYANVGSQYRFLFAPNGKHSVDHVFRYENQEGLIDFLETRLDLALDLPRVNVSPVMSLELDPKIESKLRRKLSDDFDLWDRLDAGA